MYPDDVIELLIYCHYILGLYNQTCVIGSLTDGANLHGIYIKKDDGTMKISKYLYFRDPSESQFLFFLLVFTILFYDMMCSIAQRFTMTEHQPNNSPCGTTYTMFIH